ncbi:MAG: hypothetical protein R3261_03320 [Alphaproteobacteria bacterium]|nr:hypothetical protein [Alphaproteobacteria bacterium]
MFAPAVLIAVIEKTKDILSMVALVVAPAPVRVKTTKTTKTTKTRY